MALNDPDRCPLRIADVERATGLSKDVLRIWERRYGFPVPIRDAQGRRLYAPEQVVRLRLLRSLVDRGGRPAALMQESNAALEERLRGFCSAPAVADGHLAPAVAEALEHLAADRADALDDLFHRQLLEIGLRRFLVDVAAPLTTAVGEAWAAGRLAVHQEHVFSDRLLRFLAETTARWRTASRGAMPMTPRVLLATLPGEMHLIGLAMVEAWVTMEGGSCLQLGGGLPPAEIAAAAKAHRADIVALSFSSHFDPSDGRALLDTLLALLPEPVLLWVGGGHCACWDILHAQVLPFTDVAAIGPAIAAWRDGQARA